MMSVTNCKSASINPTNRENGGIMLEIDELLGLSQLYLRFLVSLFTILMCILPN